jgi:hypothetical protein
LVSLVSNKSRFLRFCEDMRFVIFLVAALSLGQSERPGALVGTWSSNFSKSQLPTNYQYRGITLQFATVLDTITIGSAFALVSGQEVRATELFHLDGKPHPGTLNPGVTISAKWVNPRKLETNATKDGKDAGVVTYEVSADGKTLTSRYSTAPEQVLVFDRQ